MGRFVEGADRSQLCLLPECLDDRVEDDNPVQVIEAFVDALDLPALGFAGATPAATGRPSHHPAVPLRLYIYGYLSHVQSSRRLGATHVLMKHLPSVTAEMACTCSPTT